MRFQFDSGDREGWIALAIIATVVAGIVIVDIVALFMEH